MTEPRYRLVGGPAWAAWDCGWQDARTEAEGGAMTERFTMSEERLEAVIAQSGLPEKAVREYCLETDWPNADEHQEWLNTGSILSIAEWVRDLYEDPS